MELSDKQHVCYSKAIKAALYQRVLHDEKT